MAKVFRGKDIGLLVRQTERLFEQVYIAKPKCSRNSSIEGFLVGLNFKGRDVIGLTSEHLNLWDALTTLNHLQNFSSVYFEKEEEKGHEVKFVACGKNETLDPDMTYALETDAIRVDEKEEKGEIEGGKKVGEKRAYKYLEPVQGPINAPYK